jgi:hypothetical protein
VIVVASIMATRRSPPRHTIRSMPSEPLLIGIASIAAVIAGFTAVTATLAPPGGDCHPTMRIRQRAVVSTSFNVMFEALAPLIAFAWLGDARAALVVTSAVVAVYATGIVIVRGRQLRRAGGRWSPATVLLFTLGPIAALLFWANALVFASVAVYALALSIQLLVAVVSFYSLISASQN